MSYQRTATISGHFSDALRGLALDGEDRLYAVGDAKVKVFSNDGEFLREWPTAEQAGAVAVRGERVVVGEAGQVEIFTTGGDLVETWRDAERMGLVTALAVLANGDLLVADAAARCIRRYDGTGLWLNNIGDQHRKGGFHIPNGVVDFAVDAEDVVHVSNPGMHRVERYRPDGEYLGYFGSFHNQDPAGFPGCCNPTNVALDADGRVYVTEKAGPRAKVYDGEGNLLAVIADGDTFDAACKNMDVVVDSQGRVYVADTQRLDIQVFKE